MKQHKGKWIAAYNDTFNLDCTLAPIIHAGLVKFREQSDKDGFGWPRCDDIPTPEDWFTIIDKMIYAFDYSNEPDIRDYDFKIDWLRDKPENIPFKAMVSNQEEWNRYCKDQDKWDEDQQEGMELFGKYFKSLWW